MTNDSTADRDKCGWVTGTVYTGPQVCGKPAKFTTDSGASDNGLVCGVHARTAQRWGADVTPINR